MPSNNRRLERAEKLIGGLGGEKDRWTQRAADLTKDFNNVVGNIVVSSGVIAYLGTFTHTFREKIIAAWKAALQAASIPVSEVPVIVIVLAVCATDFQFRPSRSTPSWATLSRLGNGSFRNCPKISFPSITLSL